MRVKDIMTRPVHTVAQDASVESTAELMTTHRITALPVVDRQGGGVARISGEFGTETERAVVAVLARTVPGVAAVDVGALSTF